MTPSTTPPTIAYHLAIEVYSALGLTGEIMQVRLTFRELVAADANPTCLFVPEREEYERYFSAVVEDMRAINGVIEVVAQNDHVVTVTIGELDLEGFKACLKPILQHNFCYLRIADIAPLPRAGEA